MSTTTQPRVDLPRLRLEFAGEVIGPCDAGYDEARKVFMPAIDKRPAAIVRPVDDAAVASVVALARESEVELAVRGGGHSLPGHGVSDGGLVVAAVMAQASPLKHPLGSVQVPWPWARYW